MVLVSSMVQVNRFPGYLPIYLKTAAVNFGRSSEVKTPASPHKKSHLVSYRILQKYDRSSDGGFPSLIYATLVG